MGKKNTGSVPQLTINNKTGQRIPPTIVDSERDLGIIFYPQLKFHEHTQKTISKASQLISLIRQSFKHLNDDTFLKLYKGIGRPTIEYGNVIWGPQYKIY